MIVKCPGCGKAYDIPDDRLPKKKKASFTCPECKGLVELDLEKLVSTNRLSDKQTEPTTSEDKKTNTLKKSILQTMNELPPMPQVISEVRTIMSDPRSGFKDIAKVIEKDQAIAARVLQIANSAYYGMSGMVSSIHQASVVLGHKALNEILTVVGASALLGKKLKGYNIGSEALWRHSIAVAIGAKTIAAKKHPAIENEAFSAGLIHDSGKLVLDEYLFEKKKIFENKLTENKNNLIKAEKNTLGFDHAEIASALCKKWSIPDDQNVAIRFHHCPSESPGNRMAYILHIADLAATMDSIGLEGFMKQVEGGALDYINLAPEDMESIAQEINLAVEKMTENI
ncbi:MAG: zinc-ribbon domain-containing protein [Desulfosarcina sp.]|nr:zinc-ribbon domain-containing protein [Desulfobacterales bacterium]